MLRLTEIALFAAPLVAFVAMRLLFGRRGPTGAAVAVAAVGIVLLGVVLLWFGVRQALPPGAPYRPAHLDQGRIVPPDAPR